MTVEELKALLESGAAPLVLDVREGAELALAPFPFEVKHIPMGQLVARVGELPKNAPIVCACRSGARSASVVQYLRQRGFPLAVNLEGGILAWARRVDPGVGVY